MKTHSNAAMAPTPLFEPRFGSSRSIAAGDDVAVGYRKVDRPQLPPSRLMPLQMPLFLLLLLLSSRLPETRAQRPYPLMGADGPLPTNITNGTIPHSDISATVLLERVVKLLERENAYEAVWWLVLSWTDFNAGRVVQASTAATAGAAATSISTNCSRYCDSGGLASMGCCDGIWLPHIEMLNILQYFEDQLPRYRINANPNTGIVTWSTRLVGKWYTPLDFRAYPFEHQHLLFEFALADSQSTVAGLLWDHVAQLNNTAHTKGADLAGWRINWSKAKVYDSQRCYKDYNVTAPRYDVSSTAPFSNASGSEQVAGYQAIAIHDRYFANNTARGTTKPKHCGLFKKYDESRALYGPVVLVADIMVKRVSSYYVLTNLLPIVLITVITFVVFFMPQKALGERMGVVLTMFLSLTAMQFVCDFPPANYINALQMVVIVSYIIIALACIESLIVNRIATVSECESMKKTFVQKYGALLARRRHPGSRLGSVARSYGKGGSANVGHRGGQVVRASSLLSRLGSKGRSAAASAATGAATGMGQAGSTNGSTANSPRVEFPVVGSQGLLQETPVRAPQSPSPPITPPTKPIPKPAEASLVHDPTTAAAAAGPSLPTSYAVSTNGPWNGASDPTAFSAPAPVTASKHRTGSFGCCVYSGPPESDAGLLSADAADPVTTPPQVLSPFASTRNYTSFNVAQDEMCLPPITDQNANGDARCAGNDGCSGVSISLTNTRDNCVAMGHRYRKLGLWRTFGLMLAALWGWAVSIAKAPRHLYQQCKEDPVFATFVATCIDKWCCIISIILYTVAISVLLVIEVRVGDHKMMLGDAPGNM